MLVIQKKVKLSTAKSSEWKNYALGEITLKFYVNKLKDSFRERCCSEEIFDKTSKNSFVDLKKRFH